MKFTEREYDSATYTAFVNLYTFGKEKKVIKLNKVDLNLFSHREICRIALSVSSLYGYKVLIHSRSKRTFNKFKKLYKYFKELGWNKIDEGKDIKELIDFMENGLELNGIFKEMGELWNENNSRN